VSVSPTSSSEGFWRRLSRRLTSSNNELVTEQLAHEAEVAGCQQIQGARVRDRVHLRGTVQAITLSPEIDKGGLDVDLDDGTGRITLVWMGRRLIPGIDVGRRIDVWGTLTISEGRRVIFNPAYQLAP
jgi:RecJ-like exonuclease